MLETSDSELAGLLKSPFAAETLSDPGGMVVLVAADGGTTDADAIDQLRSLPCIVVATDRQTASAPPLADVAGEDGVASVDDILAVVERHPIAATSLVLCLRQHHDSLGNALIAESATYSLLQAGHEFAAWRASHPTQERQSDPGPVVLVERDGDRLELTLNRPSVRNALNRDMRDALLEGLAVARADPSIRSVVLRGEGKSFCSGGDLNEFGTFPDPASAHTIRLAASIGREIAGLGSRVAAHVHGACAGSGVELAAFAPRVVALADYTATLPEVTMGLIPGAGGTASITRRIGRHRMALLALSRAEIDAPTALRWGLVDELAETAVSERAAPA